MLGHPTGGSEMLTLDISLASWVDNHLTEWIQPPSLRAPEVILGIPWNTKVDLWSAACTVGRKIHSIHNHVLESNL